MQTALFKKTAVLMEQNAVQCSLYKDTLIASGFDVSVAKTPLEGLLQIKEKPCDLMVINVEIAEESFLEKLIHKMQCEKATKFMPIIGLSIYDKENKKNMLKNLDAFLIKPISIDRFIETVQVCIEKKHDDSQNPSDKRL
ncbi:MAG: hypothetical protein LBT70_05000 [Holosporaceae bacterium]|jgi:DNA-binding response OmpR family regulator|nr:hypothetical protein [Holosporaceae bacterium]